MPPSVLPKNNEEYETREYWDRRYSNEMGENPDASFDWFKSYSQIEDLVQEFVKPDDRILMLGCGNSTLSEEMYDAGYKNIVNIDFSSVLIEKMREKHEETRPEMTWLEMDIRALKFENNSFDIAIDKGTMDAMMTSKGDVWDPPTHVIENCNKEVNEVIRILKPGGIFLYLTFGQPHFRKRYLLKEDTSLQIRTLGEAFHYFLYILKKTRHDENSVQITDSIDSNQL